MNSDRDQYVNLAKSAEQAKLYEWMAEYMENAVYAGEEKLTVEECNLLYTAFYNYADLYRQALCTYASHLVPTTRSRNEGVLVAICRRVVNLVDSLLQRPVETVASRMFYLKMKGDYLRYLAEANLALSPGTDAAEAACKAYEQAQAFDEANAELAALRLGHLSLSTERNFTRIALS